jgi:hypothetical protein
MKQSDVAKLSELFRAKYGRDLIGKKLGQFHGDFESLDGMESFAVKSVFCGKKMYLDKLTNDNGLIAFHTRMKGIKNDVIGIPANKLYPKLDPVEYKNNLFYTKFGMNKSSIEQLYEDLFKGISIDFDLCLSQSPCFQQNSDYSISTKLSFIRRIICQ